MDLALERLLLDLLSDVADLPVRQRYEEALRRSADNPALQQRVREIVQLATRTARMGWTGGGARLFESIDAPRDVGEYRIIEEVGRGGMATVYLAERSGEGFTHRVALKIASELVDSNELAERFLQERRLLAPLKHPGIVQMYDGGETADGLPYLIMEYVDGMSLGAWLTNVSPDRSARLLVFRQLCEALSFAHRNLVIHRDLSPANIMIRSDGGVKLIDFGIAQQIDDPSRFISDRASPRTARYTAPERTAGGPSTTATDIWSLGVLLGEMIADHKWPRSRDILAIVEKASAPEPDGRYSSVDALLEDVVAYDAGHAVKAVRPRNAYRVRRFVGRHPIASAVTALASVLTTAGVAAMAILFVRAVSAEREADVRFSQVHELAGFMMFDLHDQIQRLDGATPVRQALIDQSIDYLDLLSLSPEASDDLRIDLVRGYTRLAEVSGNAGYSNLGKRAEGSELLRKAAAIMDDLAAASDDDQVRRVHLELLHAQAMQALMSDSDPSRAIDLTLQMDAMFDALASPAPEDQLLKAKGLELRAYARLNLSEFERGVEEAREALAYLQDHSAALAVLPLFEGALASANTTLGELLAWEVYAQEEGDFSEAIAYLDEGVRLLRNTGDAMSSGVSKDMRLVTALLKRANTTCYADGMTPNALSDLEEATRLARDASDRDPQNVKISELAGYAQIQMSECLFNIGRAEEAVKIGGEAVASSYALLALEPTNANYALQAARNEIVFTFLLDGAGDRQGACAAALRGQELLRPGGASQSELPADAEATRAEAAAFLEGCAN